MSNNLNLNKYQSKSLQEYYIKVIEIKDPYIGNGWGWFVDFDLKGLPKSTPIQIIQNYKSYKKQYPTIRSTKSIRNLHQLDNKMNNKMNIYKYSNFICINLLGMIVFTMIYYIID